LKVELAVPSALNTTRRPDPEPDDQDQDDGDDEEAALKEHRAWRPARDVLPSAGCRMPDAGF
jgi:hypothetical protein